MKLKFKQQEFQTEAVNAVCALFDGQQRQTSTFSMEQSGGQTFFFNETGIANALHITDKNMLTNMRAVQKNNLLPQTEDLQGRQFSLEMETGTGKTYVYTKTVYELKPPIWIHKIYYCCSKHCDSGRGLQISANNTGTFFRTL